MIELLNWLENSGFRNITIVDNASTFLPLCQFLAQCHHKVIYLAENLGHAALWRLESLKQQLDTSYFVWTDPDIIPEGPQWSVDFLYDLLQRYPSYVKAGFGLRFDNLPKHYHLKNDVIKWESSLYTKQIEPDVFEAPIDTTFALYRPKTPYCFGPALRATGLFSARHTPWYINSSNMSEEEIFYRTHAEKSITHWNVDGVVPRIEIPAMPPQSASGPAFRKTWRLRHLKAAIRFALPALNKTTRIR